MALPKTAKVYDNFKQKISGIISSGDNSIQLEELPKAQTINRKIISIENSMIEVGDIAEIKVDDIIYNNTKKDFAYIKQIKGTSIEITTSTEEWTANDNISINPFFATITEYQNNDVIRSEKIFVERTEKNVLQVLRGIEKDEVLGFGAGAFLEQTVDARYINEATKQTISLKTGNIKGLASLEGVNIFKKAIKQEVDGIEDNDLVRKSQLVEATASAGASFILSGERVGKFYPKKLKWGKVITSGNYKIFRDGVEIATLSSDINEYSDDTRLGGDINYFIKAIDINDYQVSSNSIAFLNSSKSAMTTKYFGDSSDGILTTQNLIGGKFYEFSEVNIPNNTKIEISGNGDTVILVNGNFKMGLSTEFSNISDTINHDEIKIFEKTLAIQKDGTAGGGGGGGGANISRSWGSAKGGDYGSDYGRGGDGGGNNSYPEYMGRGGAIGERGKDGKKADFGSSYYYYGGGGGGGGKGGKSKSRVIIIVKGNIDVLQQANFTGDGNKGSSGASGASGRGWSGGAGGVGLQGSGASFYFFHKGEKNILTSDTNGGGFEKDTRSHKGADGSGDSDSRGGIGGEPKTNRAFLGKLEFIKLT